MSDFDNIPVVSNRPVRPYGHRDTTGFDDTGRVIREHKGLMPRIVTVDGEDRAIYVGYEHPEQAKICYRLRAFEVSSNSCSGLYLVPRSLADMKSA